MQTMLGQLEGKLAVRLDSSCRRHVEDAMTTSTSLQEMRQAFQRVQSEQRHLGLELGRLPAARDIENVLEKHKATLESRINERLESLEHVVTRQQQQASERMDGRSAETWRLCLQRMSSLEEKALLQTDVARLIEKTMNEVRRAGPELLGNAAAGGGSTAAAVADMRTGMRRLEAKLAGCEARLLGLSEDTSAEGRVWRASAAAKLESFDRVHHELSSRLVGVEAAHCSLEESTRRLAEQADTAARKAMELAQDADARSREAPAEAARQAEVVAREQLSTLEAQARGRTEALKRDAEAASLHLQVHSRSLESLKQDVIAAGREQTAMSDSVASLKAEMAQIEARTNGGATALQESLEKALTKGLADLRHDLQIRIASTGGNFEAHASKLSASVAALDGRFASCERRITDFATEIARVESLGRSLQDISTNALAAAASAAAAQARPTALVQPASTPRSEASGRAGRGTAQHTPTSAAERQEHTSPPLLTPGSSSAQSMGGPLYSPTPSATSRSGVHQAAPAPPTVSAAEEVEAEAAQQRAQILRQAEEARLQAEQRRTQEEEQAEQKAEILQRAEEARLRAEEARVQAEAAQEAEDAKQRAAILQQAEEARLHAEHRHQEEEASRQRAEILRQAEESRLVQEARRLAPEASVGEVDQISFVSQSNVGGRATAASGADWSPGETQASPVTGAAASPRPVGSPGSAGLAVSPSAGEVREPVGEITSIDQATALADSILGGGAHAADDAEADGDGGLGTSWDEDSDNGLDLPDLGGPAAPRPAPAAARVTPAASATSAAATAEAVTPATPPAAPPTEVITQPASTANPPVQARQPAALAAAVQQVGIGGAASSHGPTSPHGESDGDLGLSWDGDSWDAAEPSAGRPATATQRPPGGEEPGIPSRSSRPSPKSAGAARFSSLQPLPEGEQEHIPLEEDRAGASFDDDDQIPLDASHSWDVSGGQQHSFDHSGPPTPAGGAGATLGRSQATAAAKASSAPAPRTATGATVPPVQIPQLASTPAATAAPLSAGGSARGNEAPGSARGKSGTARSIMDELGLDSDEDLPSEAGGEESDWD
eukprot:TRINITY_DN10356_c0_g1_i1.p1 TRINITY_DN10356_c0_g1~~TRINITY_DN10356_c0_g1_i1.p1  ORF type:complete len:1072 (-),score=263.74 TRINITY_DN10356_c0_g1_i1:361-3576(-)